MLRKMMGGGEERTIEVKIKPKEKASFKARIGLYGTWLGVLLEGPFTGYLVMPKWQDLRKLVTSSKEISRIKWTPKLLEYQPIILYEGLRQTYHILKDYGKTPQYGERRLMVQAIKAAKELNLACLGLRKGNVEEYGKKLNEMVDQIERQVGKTFGNPYKREGIGYFERLRRARDKRGRPSETVKMVEAKAAERRFQKRLNDISYIIPVITERRKVLEILRDMIELRLQETKDFLTDLLSRYEYGSPLYDPLSREIIKTRLVSLSNEMSAIDMQPYTFTAMMIVKEFKIALDCIEICEFHEAGRYLNFSLRSLEFKDIQRVLEDLIMQITVFLEGGDIIFSPSLIAAKTRELQDKLDQISEEGFQIKTKAKIIQWLDVARPSLLSGSRESLNFGRDCLKKASYHMHEMP